MEGEYTNSSESVRVICPLLSINVEGYIGCKKEKCGFWFVNKGCCGVPALTYSMDKIGDMMEHYLVQVVEIDKTFDRVAESLNRVGEMLSNIWRRM